MLKKGDSMAMVNTKDTMNVRKRSDRNLYT